MYKEAQRLKATKWQRIRGTKLERGFFTLCLWNSVPVKKKEFKMFCPKCKSEYREGFYKCADCDVDLAYGQPPENEGDVSYVEMVEVFSTYNQGDIAFIKSVFDGEEIKYYFQGENSNLMVGGGAYARLLVKADEADRAREILQDLEFLDK
jgi:hypothetical protein